MNVVVAGPGLMGSQIGCEYALAGHRVVFLANRLDKANERIASAINLISTLDLWPADAVSDLPNRISVVTDLDQIDFAVDVVLESIVEELDAKVALLGDIARRFPEAILASNTSAIPITAIGRGCGAPERTVGTHYWNPPLLMPLVEVISGDDTDPDVFQRTADLVTSLGKKPVLVRKDVPGFVWNRMQLAMLREAVWIVENGVATPEMVDLIMRDGLARRWRHTGPFQTAALGGPATFTMIANNLWPELSTATELENLGPFLESDPDRLAAIRIERDAGLVRELKRERET